MVHIDEAALDRYQRLAARSPSRYRAQVTAMAIAGDVTLTAAQIVPIVLPIAFGVLLYPHPLLVWMAVAAVIFFVWIMRPQLRTSGRQLQRSDAPALFEAIDAMRERLQVPGRIEVWLDDEFNAGAGEGRGLFGLLGTRRVLTLGMPFLACLSKDDVLSVVAHELGHFSRRHGLLGNWLYRARMGWAQYAQLAERPTSPLERATSWYARQFAPRFLTLSLVHSRACEYEADRDAAALVGASKFAHALTRVALISEAGWSAFQREMSRWHQDMPEPPADFHARLHAEMQAQIGRHQRDWMAQALAVASGWHDTHPCLAERLKAIGERAAVESVDRTAGEMLLGAAWPSLAAEFDAKWHAEQAPAWRIQHEAHKRIWAPLLRGAPDADGRTREDRLLRARILRTLDPPAGLAELQRLYEEQPEDAAAGFLLGAALLRENRREGVEVMRAVAEREACFSEAAYSRLYAYAQRISDGEGEKRWGRRWQLAAAALAPAAEHAFAEVRAGKACPSRLKDDVAGFLAAALQADPAIERAWLVCTIEAVSDGRDLNGRIVVHVLLLRMNTEAMRSVGDAEEKVCERYQSAVAAVMPAEDVVLSMSFLTTEPAPGYLDAYPALMAQAPAAAA